MNWGVVRSSRAEVRSWGATGESGVCGGGSTMGIVAMCGSVVGYIGWGRVTVWICGCRCCGGGWWMGCEALCGERWCWEYWGEGGWGIGVGEACPGGGVRWTYGPMSGGGACLRSPWGRWASVWGW